MDRGGTLIGDSTDEAVLEAMRAAAAERSSDNLRLPPAESDGEGE